MTFPRKQQVEAVFIPVTRSLSGPITVWLPSAVNSMLSVWELMSRFWVCPWVSFGPATTTTTTIPEGVWQKWMKNEINHQNVYFLSLLHVSKLLCLESIMRHSHAFLSPLTAVQWQHRWINKLLKRNEQIKDGNTAASEVISLHPLLQPCKRQI